MAFVKAWNCEAHSRGSKAQKSAEYSIYTRLPWADEADRLCPGLQTEIRQVLKISGGNIVSAS